MRKPTFHPEKLVEGKWHEYLVRFVFGGLVATGAGWVAHRYGPIVGGLFLAFPSIFPASVTLIQQREEEKHDGDEGEQKGKDKAARNTVGAVWGCFGLMVFGFIVWQFGQEWDAWLCLFAALVAWLATAFVFWAVQQWIHPIPAEAPQEKKRQPGSKPLSEAAR